MSTSAELGVPNALHQKLAQDPTMWTRILLETLSGLRAGSYEAWFVDCLMQFDSSHKAYLPDLYDAYVFAEFWAELNIGYIGYVTVPVPDVPRPDADQDANDQILRALPAPFSACFHGGPGDCDGMLTWDRDIPLQVAKRHEREELSAPAIPSFAPLEVGTTASARSLMHLRMEGALARWPYGYRQIGLFIQLCRPGDAVPLSPHPSDPEFLGQLEFREFRAK